jgi:hypothetical protein
MNLGKKKDRYQAPVPAAGVVPRLLEVRGRGRDGVVGWSGPVRPVTVGEDVAGSLVTEVDAAVERPVAARAEAVRLIAQVLRVPATAEAVAAAGVRVRITAGSNAHAHVEMTKTTTAAVDDTAIRVSARGGVVELPARNLLGEEHDGGPVQDEGYAEAVHEAAHLVYFHALSGEQLGLVGRLFDAKRAAGPDQAWTDDYASRSASEWWAQETTAYFGYNHGVDPFTGRERLNGPGSTDPGLRGLLETVYGPPEVSADPRVANPLAATRAEAGYYQGFRDFTALTEASVPSTASHHETVIGPGEVDTSDHPHNVEGDSGDRDRPTSHDPFTRDGDVDTVLDPADRTPDRADGGSGMAGSGSGLDVGGDANAGSLADHIATLLTGRKTTNLNDQ